MNPWAISAETAREVRARVAAAGGNVHAAAHQVRVELRAIEPFTSRDLSRVLALLARIAALADTTPADAAYVLDLVNELAGCGQEIKP